MSVSKPFLSSVEVEPEASAVASVIWMHGLGADGHDFASVPPQLDLPSECPVRYVFPHAPSIPVTINQGTVMPAWYDVKSFEARGQDEAGIRRSAGWIRELVVKEVQRGIAPERIVLAGFSQGGAMALFTGLRYPERLAGLMILSGYLLLAERLALEASEANHRTPIFQAHGLHDPVVPFLLGRHTHDGLERAGYQVEWHEYPVEHQVCLEELHDISRWLTMVLSD